MWQVFPKILVFKIIFFLFTALFLSIFLSKVDINEAGTFTSALTLITPVTLLFLGLIYVIGKWGWKLLWKAPWLGNLLNKAVCPDVNGIWVGEIESNYGGKPWKIIPIELTIKADMFGFEISQLSLDGYSNSKVIQCEVFKDPRTKSFSLYYLYEAYVPKPEKNDDSTFYGAAKLDIVFNDNSMELQGTYWTNRAWQRMKNTAGRITARRQI